MDTQITTQLELEAKNMLFNIMSDGVITVDENGMISYCNNTFCKLFQKEEEEIMNKDFQGLFLTNRKNKAFNKLFQNCMSKNHFPEKTVVKYENGDTIKYFSLDINPLNLYNESLKDIEKEPKFPGMIVLIEDVTDNYLLKQHSHDCAYIFAGMIIAISLYLMTWRFIRFTLHIHLKTYIYTLLIEGITFALFLEIIFFTSLRLRDIGLILRISTLKKDSKKTLILSFFGCLLLLLARIITIIFKLPGKTYFIGGSFHGLTFYLFTAIFQEFLARGVMQTSVKSLMQVKYKKFFGILLTSLLFSLMHMPFGFIFMVCSFVLSLILGYIYEKQRSIWGCAFLHWSCGYLAMALFF